MGIGAVAARSAGSAAFGAEGAVAAATTRAAGGAAGGATVLAAQETARSRAAARAKDGKGSPGDRAGEEVLILDKISPPRAGRSSRERVGKQERLLPRDRLRAWG